MVGRGGPLYIKFGQSLSTRPDLLPEDIAKELSKLQDDVPPFSEELALEIMNASYPDGINDAFSEFDAKALASASVAQAHAAKLPLARKSLLNHKTEYLGSDKRRYEHPFFDGKSFR